MGVRVAWVVLACGIFGAAPGDAAQQPLSVWSGVYTADQAVRGEVAFRPCAYCHGRGLQGGDDPPGPALKGEIFLARWQGRSLGELFDKMVETMPRNAPGTLAVTEYVDVIAYLLAANGATAGMQELTVDVAALDRWVFAEKPLQR